MLLILKREAKIPPRDPETLCERLALGDFAARSVLLEFDYAQDDTAVTAFIALTPLRYASPYKHDYNPQQAVGEDYISSRKANAYCVATRCVILSEVELEEG